MRIQDITPVTGDRTVYIVGTGPSLRCMDTQFFHDKTCIGLNQAYKHLPLKYSITVHPELLAEYEAAVTAKFDARKNKDIYRTNWVVKKKPPRADLELDDARFYVFHTSYDLDTVVRRPENTLYLGEGVQTCAIDLAARMGALFVVLVGCDAGTLGGDFHAHDQHVRWLGMKPADQYKAYRDTTAGVRRLLRPKGVSVMSLTPFIGVTAAEEDYARLVGELGLPDLPKPKDTSTYLRDPSTIRTGH